MKAKINRILNLLIIFGILVSAVFLFSSCVGSAPTDEADSGTVTPSPTSLFEAPNQTATAILEDIVVERTPLPTTEPGMLELGIQEALIVAGLDKNEILGLNVTNWVSLILSVIYVLIGYMIGTFVVIPFLKRFAQRAPSGLEQTLLNKIFSDLRWFVVLLIASYTTRSITFLSDNARTVIGDIYFILGIILVYRITANFINLAYDWYRNWAVAQDRDEELGPVITLLVRIVRVIVGIVFLALVLDHYGVNISAFAAALGIGGLALSLAAQDTIADAISGFLILIDRPFRKGDRIEIQGVGTWGDVVEIGLRTTRIRTRDNRMVIVPNSIIGSNQVINYSYPDPRYRIETHVGVGYGSDIEYVRNLIIETVRKLEFVLPEKPVDALYIEMGDSAMIFRVRWWIRSYVDTRRAEDSVHTALQIALDEAGIDCPFPTQSIRLQVEDQSDQASNISPDPSVGKHEYLG